MNRDCFSKKNVFAKGANILFREILTACDMVKLVVQAGNFRGGHCSTHPESTGPLMELEKWVQLTS